MPGFRFCLMLTSSCPAPLTPGVGLISAICTDLVVPAVRIRVDQRQPAILHYAVAEVLTHRDAISGCVSP
jgi:hypothetical protein